MRRLQQHINTPIVTSQKVILNIYGLGRNRGYDPNLGVNLAQVMVMIVEAREPSDVGLHVISRFGLARNSIGPVHWFSV